MRLAPLALVTALAAACSSSAPSGGIMLVISSADLYAPDDYDALQITVGAKTETRAGKDITFPTTLGVNGAPRGPLKVEVRALKDGVVRVANAVKTTASVDRTVVLPITLSAACRDRCVQVAPSDALTEYCDPQTRACVPEASLAVPLASLKTYDKTVDPTRGLARVACGDGAITQTQTCNGKELGEATCANVLGAGSTGELACVACRGVASASCTNGEGLQDGAPWPIVGRSNVRTGRGDHAGPRRAPRTLKPLVQESLGSPISSPAIDASGTVWFTSSFFALPQNELGNQAAKVISVVGSDVHFFQPDPALDCRLDLGAEGSAGCRWSTPIIVDDGSMWTMTNTGEGFSFTSPDFSSPPKRTVSIFDALGASCTGQAYCNVTRLGAQVRSDGGKRYAWVPTGAGIMIFRQDGTAWTLQTQTPEVATWDNLIPAIARDGTTYVSLEFVFPNKNAATGVAAVDKKGAFKWRSPSTKGLTTPPVVGPDDTVYFGSTGESVLFALDPNNPRAFKWKYPTGGATTSPAIGVDGTLYFGSADQNLYALDPSDLSLKWSLRVKGAIAAQPILDGQGVIYFGTGDGRFYAVGPNGAVIFETIVGSPIVEPAGVAADGTVYFGSNDGFIFAIPKQ